MWQQIRWLLKFVILVKLGLISVSFMPDKDILRTRNVTKSAVVINRHVKYYFSSPPSPCVAVRSEWTREKKVILCFWLPVKCWCELSTGHVRWPRNYNKCWSNIIVSTCITSESSLSQAKLTLKLTGSPKHFCQKNTCPTLVTQIVMMYINVNEINNFLVCFWGQVFVAGEQMKVCTVVDMVVDQTCMLSRSPFAGLCFFVM